jgi:RNA polymerase sigma factor (sigma-70 family)
MRKTGEIHVRVTDQPDKQRDEAMGAPVDQRAAADDVLRDDVLADGALGSVAPAADRPGPVSDDLTGAASGPDGEGALADGPRDVPVDDPPSVGAEVVREAPRTGPAELRVDFGAHLEANYQRLVAQLYAITLDPGEAHDVVQDAYSRAWRFWPSIGRMPDPSAWIRRVAVRSTIRSWRRVLARIGIKRPQPSRDGVDARTGALLAALARLSPGERRAVVLFHMAGASLEEIAGVEQASVGTVQARLARARQVVTEGMADVLPEVLGAEVEAYGPDGQDGDDQSPYSPDAYGVDRYGSGAYGVDAYGSGGYRAPYAEGYGSDGYDDDGGRR